MCKIEVLVVTGDGGACELISVPHEAQREWHGDSGLGKHSLYGFVFVVLGHEYQYLGSEVRKE